MKKETVIEIDGEGNETEVIKEVEVEYEVPNKITNTTTEL